MGGAENSGVNAQNRGDGSEFADMLFRRAVKPAVAGFPAGVNDGPRLEVEFVPGAGIVGIVNPQQCVRRVESGQ